MTNNNGNLDTKENDRAFSRRISLRLEVLLVIVLLAFVGLGIRLIFITRSNFADYSKKILSQQAVDSQTLSAKRGEILDANGTVLAGSRDSYNVILDTAVFDLANEDTSKRKTAEKEATLSALVSIFGIDRSTVSRYMDDVPSSRYYIVKKNVSYEEMSRFLPYITVPEEDKKEGSLYNDKVMGVWFEKFYTRYYPQGKLACDLIGFSKSEGQASYGLEEYYNDILTGSNGRTYGYKSGDSTMEVDTISAVDGNNLVTTIDANVQMMVEKNIKKFNDEYKDNAREGFGANNIGVIVMRADSAEIIAMASYPDYDLNSPDDISMYFSEEDINRMSEDGTLKDAYDGLWKNFCISDTYEPGSVMKPFTVAMGLETGKLTGNETFYCTGSLAVADHTIHCHNTSGDGLLNLRGAVAKSCNVALMECAAKIGKETFLEYQNIFNLGLKTNVDLSGESRTDSLVFNETTLNESELATASFGQGFNVTMIQMAAGYAALVNGGYYYEPHVVSRILSPSGAVVKNIEPRLVKQIISNSTSDEIRSYCNTVVSDGTGWRAEPAGYLIGGKTGTAETLPRGNGEYVVSFICHAPADDPEIICYVVIDRPNVEIQEDASYATQLSNDILTEILPYLNIPMTEELTQKDMEKLMDMDLSVFTNRVEKEEDTEDVSQNDISEN